MSSGRPLISEGASWEEAIKNAPRTVAGAADLCCADLSGLHLSLYHDIDPNILQGANLRGANLRGARLRGVNLSGVSCTWASWCGAVLYDVNLSRIEGSITMIGVEARRVDFTSTWWHYDGNDYLHEGNLSRSTIVDCNFTGCYFNRNLFNILELKRCDFTNATMIDSEFQNMTIADCTFKNTNLNCSRFKNVHIENTNFSACSLKDVDKKALIQAGARLDPSFFHCLCLGPD